MSDQILHSTILFAIFLTSYYYIIMILSFWTDRSGQTMQTKIRLKPSEDQSDQVCHCLLAICIFESIIR